MFCSLSRWHRFVLLEAAGGTQHYVVHINCVVRISCSKGPAASPAYFLHLTWAQLVKQHLYIIVYWDTKQNQKLDYTDCPGERCFSYVPKTSQFPTVLWEGFGRPRELVPLPASNQLPAAGCGAEEFLISCTHTPPPPCRRTQTRSFPCFQKWATKSRADCFAESI